VRASHFGVMLVWYGSEMNTAVLVGMLLVGLLAAFILLRKKAPKALRMFHQSTIVISYHIAITNCTSFSLISG
jgi:LPXTG-motif cell wall-anchored protein